MADISPRGKSIHLDTQDGLECRPGVAPGGRRRMNRHQSLLSRKGSIMISSEDGASVIRPSTLVPRLENSYRMEPGRAEGFNVREVERVIRDALQRHLVDVTYDQEGAARLAVKVASLIKADVKKLSLPRYKIVVQVLINERRGQALNVSSRCLWEEKHDNYGCASYSNQHLYAVGMVHGLYLD